MGPELCVWLGVVRHSHKCFQPIHNVAIFLPSWEAGGRKRSLTHTVMGEARMGFIRSFLRRITEGQHLRCMSRTDHQSNGIEGSYQKPNKWSDSQENVDNWARVPLKKYHRQQQLGLRLEQSQ